MSFEQRIDLAASKLGLREPFIAAVVATMPRIIVTDKAEFTASTNGTWMKFGEQWGAQWNDEQLFGLYMHEALHVILMHMWRRGDLDAGLWNTANDAIINRMILNKGYQIPAGGVSIAWVKEDMDSDDVYKKLMEEAQKQPKGGKGSGNPNGGWDDQGDLEDAPDEATKADVEARIITSAKMARECGDGSALIDRILGEVGKASVRWQDEMRAVMMMTARNDFSYSRFSRRYIGRGMYFPTLRSEEMGGLAIGFDVSGSVSQQMADQLCAEIQGIVDDTNPEWVEVVYCADSITGVQRFERGEPLKLKVVGTGGTRFKPVFDHFQRVAETQRVAAFIYLTDMEGNLNECTEPEWPVIWGNVGGGDYEAPFGKVVKVRL
jgi:predicted metal-dependent peptidase